MLRAILHDWDDDRAVAILGNCRKAMTADAILLIVERVFPETATQGHAAESYLLDLEMVRAILTAAGFVVTRIVPTTTPTSIVEARPA